MLSVEHALQIPAAEACDYDRLIHYSKYIYFCSIYCDTAGRHSSVGIANRYLLDGMCIETRLGSVFPLPSRLALGLTQPPTRWIPGLSWGKSAEA